MISDKLSAISGKVHSRLNRREENLSPWATVAASSKGRSAPEPISPVRGEFQRDKDKIIHTKAFRRLKHKSQVLIAPQGDHFTTRLTHVMEVAQIARTIARALNLNEDMTEAGALGHDLGHTPFGHIGETVLNRLLPNGFHHSRHSVRIVTVLEKNGKGLNLMQDVVEAIRRHSKPEGEFINREAVADMGLEAQIVRISDALAYLTHDMQDAIRCGVLNLENFPVGIIDFLGKRHSTRVNTFVTDVIVNSWDCTGDDLSSSEVITSKPWIRMSEEAREVTNRLRNFMFERFYHPTSVSQEGLRAAEVVQELFAYFSLHTDMIPEKIRSISPNDERQAVTDYICGMTDNYALRVAERTIGPKFAAGILQGRV